MGKYSNYFLQPLLHVSTFLRGRKSLKFFAIFSSQGRSSLEMMNIFLNSSICTSTLRKSIQWNFLTIKTRSISKGFTFFVSCSWYKKELKSRKGLWRRRGGREKEAHNSQSYKNFNGSPYLSHKYLLRDFLAVTFGTYSLTHSFTFCFE